MADKTPERSLLGSSMAGVGWLGASQVARQVMSLSFKVLLARLLGPTEFGLVALATAFIAFASVFVQLGFGDAIIQRKESEFGERERSTSFWANVILGLIVCPIIILCAPWIAAAFQAPELERVIQVMSLTFVILAPRSTLRALFSRRMDFRAVGLSSVLGTFIGAVVGTVMAVLGFGVWALVAMNMVQSMAGTVIMFIAARWVPKEFIHLATLRSLWSFGMYITGVRMLNAFMRNIDTVLVGMVLGQRAVGLYSMAYQGVVLPLQYVSRPISAVVYSAFSRMEDDHQRRADAFMKTLEVLIVAGWPMGILGVSCSHVVLPALLGEHWSEVTPIFAILAVSGALQTSLQTSARVVTAAGHPGVVLGMQIGRVVVVTAGVAAGLPWGTVGVATGYMVAWVVLIPVHLIPVSVYAKVPAMGMVRVFAKSVALLSVAVAVGVGLYQSGIGPEPVRALASGGISTVIWVALAGAAMPSVRSVARLGLKRVRGRRKKA